MLQKMSNKCCCFELSTKIISSTTVFNIENNNLKKKSKNLNISKISEESCDTEALLFYIKIKLLVFCFILLHLLYFLI